jgi:hypothetical protein
MAFFCDLSEYHYSEDGFREGTVNIGWLAKGHDFEKDVPSEEILAALWEYTKIAVCITRGGHFCDLCGGNVLIAEERDGIRLLLGTAEIRVFSDDGTIFAAPNALYHYVKEHSYKLHGQFISAIVSQRVPGEDYFRKLDALDLAWSDAPHFSEAKPFRFRSQLE